MKSSDFRIFVEMDNRFLSNKDMLPFVLTSVGDMKDQTPVDRPLGHDKHHLIVVTEGSGEFTGPNGSFILSKGDGVFWHAYVPHSYKKAGASFDTAFMTFWSSDSILDYYGVGDEFRFYSYQRLLPNLDSLYNFATGDSNILSRSARGYSFIVDWLYTTLEPSVPLTVKVKRYLEINYSKQISLDDVADYVRMSKYALCHLYKETCGTTVMKELQNIRIAKAMSLLKYSNEPIGKIAERCGFLNMSYFDKVFMSSTGMTPKDYRMK